MATHSNILAWRIPWTEETGGLKSMGWQRVKYDLANENILDSQAPAQGPNLAHFLFL